jgi:hypothetical protein
MIWFMNYEFNSYEAKFGHERGDEEWVKLRLEHGVN